MRKRTKIAAILSAAAVLTTGAVFTSLAAWEQEDGIWIYTDNRGDRVTDSWRQSGNSYFYLDSDGEMATDRWIDDTYYVTSSGRRAADRWIFMEEGTDGAPNSDSGWYYFDSNGRVVTDGWRTIDNKRYHFDSDGTMQYGWYNDEDNVYYLGDENDGAAKTGWLSLDYDEDEGQEDGVVAQESESGTWFYFQANGRMVKASGESGYVSRNINNARYYFDENGIMATGWAAVVDQADDDTTGISTLKYFGSSDQGQMRRGWRYLMEDPEDSDMGDEDFSFAVASSSNADRYDGGEGAWYYFDNNGVPAYLSSNASTITEATTRINGSRYFFDEYGRMQSGLLGFAMPDGTIASAYFGADDSDGRMKNERQTNVYEEDGDRSTFYFTSTGGYTGERSGYLYSNGKLVQAEDGEDYQVFEVGGNLYLVNESGRVQTSNRTLRVDGEYRYEYYNGTIYYVNSDRERIGEVTSGYSAPSIDFESVYTLGSSAE